MWVAVEDLWDREVPGSTCPQLGHGTLVSTEQRIKHMPDELRVAPHVIVRVGPYLGHPFLRPLPKGERLEIADKSITTAA